MTNPQLFESQMYREVIRQYEEVSEFINLDSNIRERLKYPQRALVVTFPFRRDDYEEVETVVGYRESLYKSLKIYAKVFPYPYLYTLRIKKLFYINRNVSRDTPISTYSRQRKELRCPAILFITPTISFQNIWVVQMTLQI